jgi:ATP-binding cassette subfamily B protein
MEPDILILDEATASPDLGTEAKVAAAIDVLTAGRTTIVVAHRPATATVRTFLAAHRPGTDGPESASRL